MAISNRIAHMQDEIRGWRRHLRQQPEPMFDVPDTAAFVVQKPRAFGRDDITP